MKQTEQLWFLDTLVTVRVPHTAGQDRISVLESRAPREDSPPLHVHDEDEIFHVLAGEIVVRIDEQDHRLQVGDTAIGPKGLPHSYRVESEEARWLVITAGGRFEGLVRSFSRSAPRPELPPPSPPPTQEQIRALTEACQKFGIEIVGPPLY
jgi:quercetin dioxygenase-like cupin family protein